MENPCYKCGQAVEEGVAFCPHCSAPQIRVVVAEAAQPTADPAAAVADSSHPPVVRGVAAPSSGMRWSEAAKPCALAALVASILTSLGLNPFVAMFGVGFLAVLLYRQRQPIAQLTAAVGAGLGALSGILWFVVSSVAGALIVLMLHKAPELRNEMIKRVQQATAGSNDPQITALLDYLKTQTGFLVITILSLGLVFLCSIILGSLGGMLGSALLGRRNKP